MSALGTTVASARPGRVPHEVVGMAVFLFSEATLFCGLIGSYVILRSQYNRWPPLGQPALPVAVTGVTTLALLTSGALAWRAGTLPPGQRGGLLRAASGLGAVFLVVQGLEWAKLLADGLDAKAGTYGAIFTAVVGAHALHVLAALIALTVVSARELRGAYPADRDGGLRAARLFWLFVVAVWPALYGLVYLW